MDYAYFRKNLAIGDPAGGVNRGSLGAENHLPKDIKDPGKHSSFDYDAVGVYNSKYKAKIGEKSFSAEEHHGVEKITLKGSFRNVDFPNPSIPARKVPDQRLKRGSLAIDTAVYIPNLNDDFKCKNLPM